MAVEPSLHNNGPDVNSNVKDDDDVETDLGAAALAEVLHVEDIAEAKAGDAGEKSEVSWYKYSDKETNLF